VRTGAHIQLGTLGTLGTENCLMLCWPVVGGKQRIVLEQLWALRKCSQGPTLEGAQALPDVQNSEGLCCLAGRRRPAGPLFCKAQPH
jgi:hypothetical protein